MGGCRGKHGKHDIRGGRGGRRNEVPTKVASYYGDKLPHLMKGPTTP